jgi:succinoglycan biosynthesis transport protein ExoP
LESAAQPYRAQRDSLLQRYNEVVQRQSMPHAEARVIAEAIAPKDSDQPRPFLTLGFASLFGLSLGVGIALARTQMTGGFSSGVEVERFLGVKSVGVLSTVRARSAHPLRPKENDRICIDEIGAARATFSAPASRFAEVIRGARVAADSWRAKGESHLIGIVSALPREGKATVCMNLAHLVSVSGCKTLVVDADIRNSSLTRSMAPSAEAGLLQVVSGQTALQDVIWEDPISRCDFLPSGTLQRGVSQIGSMATDSFEQLIVGLRRQYEYVFVCLPPIATSVDAEAFAQLFDTFLLVIEWRKTRRPIVAESLTIANRVKGKVFGAILNKADPRFLRQSEGYNSARFEAYYY